MKIYDITKTTILDDPNLELGYLKKDKIITNIIPEENEIIEKFHYEYKEYENGGMDRVKVIDSPYVPKKEKTYEYENVLVYVPYSEDELKNIEIKKLKDELSNLTQDFTQVQVGAVIDDIDARILRFRELHNRLRVLEGKEPRQYQ